MNEPGEYFVGDLLHVVNDTSWDEIKKLCYRENEIINGTYNLFDEITFSIIKHPWKEGTLHDKNGKPFPFVRYNISCMKKEYLYFFNGTRKLKKTQSPISDYDLGSCFDQILFFEKPFEIKITHDKDNVPCVEVGSYLLTPYLQNT